MTTTNEDLMAISDKLATIKDQANKLNQATDRLNGTLEHIEKELAGAGVEYWWRDRPHLGYRERRTAEGREASYFELGYTKIGGEWCVAVQERISSYVDHPTTNPDDPDQWDDVDDGEPVPLRRAPRRIRIEAAEVLEPFLEALATEIERMASLVDKANSIVGAASEPAQPYKGSGHANPRPRPNPIANPSGHASPRPKR